MSNTFHVVLENSRERIMLEVTLTNKFLKGNRGQSKNYPTALYNIPVQFEIRR